MAEAADWWSGVEAAVRPMPVVPEHEGGEFAPALHGCVVGFCISPLAQRGLHEALGLAVGSGRVGPGPLVPDAEPAKRLGVADVI